MIFNEVAPGFPTKNTSGNATGGQSSVHMAPSPLIEKLSKAYLRLPRSQSAASWVATNILKSSSGIPAGKVKEAHKRPPAAGMAISFTEPYTISGSFRSTPLLADDLTKYRSTKALQGNPVNALFSYPNTSRQT